MLSFIDSHVGLCSLKKKWVLTSSLQLSGFLVCITSKWGSDMMCGCANQCFLSKYWRKEDALCSLIECQVLKLIPSKPVDYLPSVQALRNLALGSIFHLLLVEHLVHSGASGYRNLRSWNITVHYNSLIRALLCYLVKLVNTRCSWCLGAAYSSLGCLYFLLQLCNNLGLFVTRSILDLSSNSPLCGSNDPSAITKHCQDWSLITESGISHKYNRRGPTHSLYTNIHTYMYMYMYI